MLISVIIPCFNVESYIEECLYSVLNQTYRPIEIILIDNNSMDKTVEIATATQKKHPGYITILHESKQGLSHARNKGIDHARGKWIQFLDADDVLISNKLSRHMQMISESEKPAVMIVAAYEKMEVGGYSYTVPTHLAGMDDFQAITASYLGHIISNLFCKDAIISAGKFDTSLILVQDTWLIFKVVLSFENQILYDETPSAVYRQRVKGQLTTSNLKENSLEGLLVRQRIVEELKLKKPTYYLQNKKFYTDIIYWCIYRLGLHDSDQAIGIYRKLFYKNYHPNSTHGQFPVFHLSLIKYFGFENTLRLRKLNNAWRGIKKISAQ